VRVYFKFGAYCGDLQLGPL